MTTTDPRTAGVHERVGGGIVTRVERTADGEKQKGRTVFEDLSGVIGDDAGRRNGDDVNQAEGAAVSPDRGHRCPAGVAETDDQPGGPVEAFMAEIRGGPSETPEQPVFPWEEYEAMVAELEELRPLRERYDAVAEELQELRPLRSDLIAIRGIVTREPRWRLQ